MAVQLAPRQIPSRNPTFAEDAFRDASSFSCEPESTCPPIITPAKS
jgi:hypothetical protein